MTASILVTGGTGTLGQHVVPKLLSSGRDVRILSRQAGDCARGTRFVSGDLATGEGIDSAVKGAEIVVHLAGSSKGDDVKARHLVDAAKRAGVGHIVYISVVGADRIPMTGTLDRMMFGYFGAKRAAELIIAESGIPWTTLRATQFRSRQSRVWRRCRWFPHHPGSGSSRSTPRKSQIVLWTLRSETRPVSSPPWVDRLSTA